MIVYTTTNSNTNTNTKTIKSNTKNNNVILNPNHHLNNLQANPPIITSDQINTMTNKKELKELEEKYDKFLDENFQILLLHEIIEEYIEIRDALTIRINKLTREADKATTNTNTQNQKKEKSNYSFIF